MVQIMASSRKIDVPRELLAASGKYVPSGPCRPLCVGGQGGEVLQRIKSCRRQLRQQREKAANAVNFRDQLSHGSLALERD